MRRILLVALLAGCLGSAVLDRSALACSSSGGAGCGGGSVLAWDQPYYKPGEVARGHVEVTWPRRPTRATATPDEGPYSVYLRPQQSDFNIRAARDPEAIQVGIVIVERGRNRSGTARVEFTVPPVPGGHWLVQACDTECTHSLGDLLASPIRLVSSVREERRLISSRLDALTRSIGRTRSVGIRTQVRLRRDLRQTDADLRRVIAQLDYDVYKLTRSIRELAARSSGSDESATGMVAAVGLLTGGGVSVGGVTWLRRRRRNRRS